MQGSGKPSVSLSPAQGTASAKSRISGQFRFPAGRLAALGLLSFISLLLIGGAYLAWPNFQDEFRFWRAERAARARDFPEARQLVMANLAHRADSARDRFLLARVDRQSGAFDDASEQLDYCQEIEGASARVRLERALLQVQQGSVTHEAEAQLADYLQQGHPDTDYILEALSLGCLTNYRFASAVTYLTRWIDRQPDLAQARIWRSLAYERLVEYALARDDARQALALSPDKFETRLRLAQTLLLATEYEETAPLFAQLYQEHENDPVVAMGYAQAEEKLGHSEEAAAILDRLVARFPTETAVLLERGRLALQMNQGALAEGWLRSAARLAPANYETQYALLQSLRLQGKTQEALAAQAAVDRLSAAGVRLHDLNEQLKQRPYDIAIRCDIARLYQEQGSDKDALEWLQSAIRMDRAYPLANRLLAEYYERSGQTALAEPYRKFANSER
jgi:tetratricopeptide (TPR) repeat protein